MGVLVYRPWYKIDNDYDQEEQGRIREYNTVITKNTGVGNSYEPLTFT